MDLQAYVLVSCRSAALHSLSLLYCGQRWDSKETIQGTHFPDKRLPVKPQFSYGVCGCSTYIYVMRMADIKILRQSGYLEQKEEASYDGKDWRSSIVQLLFNWQTNTKRNWENGWIVVVLNRQHCSNPIHLRFMFLWLRRWSVLYCVSHVVLIQLSYPDVFVSAFRKMWEAG